MRYISSIRKDVVRIKTKTSTALAIIGVAVIGLGSSFGLFPAIVGAESQTVIYNNIPSPKPSNVPSLGLEATSTSEFGGQVGLSGTQRKNPKVTVLMSSWACKSGNWNLNNCITNPGSTFTHPVTLKIYNVNSDDSVGSLIKTDTETFTMPYRPTADDGTNCNAANGTAGEWWDGTSCYNGKAFTISFDLNGVTLPDDVIISVGYNTSDYGNSPLGSATACHATPQGCPYDSLNVGTNPSPTVGTAEPTEDDAYVNGTSGYAYCDNGAGGLNALRLDEGCWTGYLPAFKVEASSGKDGHSRGNHHKHHDKDGYKGDKNRHHKYSGSHGYFSLEDN